MTVRDVKTLCAERMSDHFVKYYVNEPGAYQIDGRLVVLEFPGVVHHFTSADGHDADPHDHPWSFTSTILIGGYVEQVFDVEDGSSTIFVRAPGDVVFNHSETVHRIVSLLAPYECWTFVEPKGAVRKSGFYQFRGDGTYHRFWDERDWAKLESGRLR